MVILSLHINARRLAGRGASLLLSLIAVGTVIGSLPAVHGAEQTQSLPLRAGWNAVWLEVDPAEAEEGSAAVEDVFNSPAVTVVARPVTPVGTAEFVSDPQRQFNQAGWVVWYRNPESGENTLVNVFGYAAYLVFVDETKLTGGAASVTLTISGEARFNRPQWSAGRYHLTGFNLLEPVTFDEFFGRVGRAGGAHPVNLLFRLDANGAWNSVPPSDLMQPGEAYWIYAEGASEFSGPIAIDFDGGNVLDFGVGPGVTEVADGNGGTARVTLRELRFANSDDASHSIRIRRVDSGPGGHPDPTDADLGILEIDPVPEEFGHQVGANGAFEDWELGEIAAGTRRTETLGALRNWSSANAGREVLYRIEVGGHFSYLPMAAEQQAVIGSGGLGAAGPAETASGFGGLWVGVVVFDSVARLGAEAQASRATTSTAPMRILVHVDDSGRAVLLNHVTLMKQDGTPVLVVDDSKIPFYEGIETRNGKAVGVRITSVGYDMPRDWSPTSQAALVDAVAEVEGVDPGTVTEEALMAYVNGQSARPADLAEDYVMTWPLDGGFDSSLTSTGPLELDPFHRSNPFRHAFHPQHGAGLPVTRAVAITIEDNSEVGIVEGTYQETVTGLADQVITAGGAVQFKRLSAVTTLQ